MCVLQGLVVFNILVFCDLVEQYWTVVSSLLMQLVHFPKKCSMNQLIHTHLPTHKHTSSSPTSLQNPAIQWNPYNFLLFSNQKP